MIIFYLVIAIPISIGIGAIGNDRKIGFWSAFLWSVLLNPVIGLVITLLSDKKGVKTYDFVYYKNLAKDAELRGDIAEAIDYYTDSLVRLESDYKNLDMRSEVARQKHINGIAKKIEALKSLKQENIKTILESNL
jgi:hypothetical protein